MRTADVVIIGAGIVGCSIARSLSATGYATINIDPLPAAGYGSTSHSSAIVRPFYSHRTAAAIAHASRSRWLAWPEFLGGPPQPDYAQYREAGGYVLVMAGQRDSYAANLAALDATGIEWHWLEPDRLASRLPGLTPERFGPPVPMNHPRFGAPVPGEIEGAIYVPAAGYVNDPQLAARNLWFSAQATGAGFLFGERVTRLCTRAGRVCGVDLAGGSTVSAPVVINAAGPHSAVINQLAGIDQSLSIKTRPERHEVAYLRRPAGMQGAELGFFVDLDSGFYARSDGSDLLIGTTDPDCDPSHPAEPDAEVLGFTDQWTLQVMRAAQRFDGLAIEGQARGTVGLYDVSDDWIPIYDKSALPGFYLAIGTSGNQFKNAPYVGDVMLAILSHEHAGIDHDLQPASLHLREVNLTIDLGFYSRNREKQTTRSVLA